MITRYFSRTKLCSEKLLRNNNRRQFDKSQKGSINQCIWCDLLWLCYLSLCLLCGTFPQPCFLMSITSAYCNSRKVLTAFCRLWALAAQSGQYFPQLDLGTNTPPQTAHRFIWVISHVCPPFAFPLPFSPKRIPAPSLRRGFSFGTQMRCFDGRNIPFPTVIFSV